MTFFRVEKRNFFLCFVTSEPGIRNEGEGEGVFCELQKQQFLESLDLGPRLSIKRTCSAVCFSAKSFMTFLDPKV
jgi:hypothetical protein